MTVRLLCYGSEAVGMPVRLLRYGSEAVSMTVRLLVWQRCCYYVSEAIACTRISLHLIDSTH